MAHDVLAGLIDSYSIAHSPLARWPRRTGRFPRDGQSHDPCSVYLGPIFVIYVDDACRSSFNIEDALELTLQRNMHMLHVTHYLGQLPQCPL